MHQIKNIMNITCVSSKSHIEMIRSFEVCQLLRNEDILNLGIYYKYYYHQSKFSKE